ncbi:MAG: biotin transporter BioY [Candidatus Marinimicrobia bacterium]|nr:biotin transporter BioY [Candidatus Neomarinimicrobiota bacterium]|tara:strand:- start:81 stop:647 length:567 start_codon:yes stop_codon:yes gene_type:complete
MKTKIISFDQTGILSIDDKSLNIFAIILGSLLIAVLAQISIPIPFSPIPITGQTIGVILVGGILGSKRGTLAVLAYLMEGALGFPVFAQMKAGVHVLVGPTAGYLWGFVFAAFLIGYLTEKGWTMKPITSFLSCFAATTLILIAGTLYLAAFKLEFSKALVMGFYPFLVGDVVKSTICAILISGLRRI